MKLLLSFSAFFYFSLSHASVIECTSGAHKFLIQNVGQELHVSYKSETALADGILLPDEIDLVAKFKSIGEMTLFAKIGKSAPENYVFIKGKRFSVICR